LRGLITAAKIAPDSITAAKIADNVKFPEWFKIYTPEELEAKLLQRRWDKENSKPWIVRKLNRAIRPLLGLQYPPPF